MEQFLTPLIQQSATTLRPNGWSCWNVHNVGKMKMINDVALLHAHCPTTREFTVTSSKRQSNQYTASKNQKNLDRTICYSAV
jgi:hypothetical protein